jgi:hypothetical protein
VKPICVEVLDLHQGGPRFEGLGVDLEIRIGSSYEEDGRTLG